MAQEPVVSESGAWRQYYRFRVPYVSATLLKGDLPAIQQALGPQRVQQLKTVAEAQMKKEGADPATGDWRSFREDQGWKSPTLHLANPCVGGMCLSVHTSSYPFAYRELSDRALAMGRSGFARADFFQGNSLIYSMEKYSEGWQVRSKRRVRNLFGVVHAS